MTNGETQVCCRCGETKTRQGFSASRWGMSGQWCKDCYRQWHRERYTPKTGADDAPRDCAWCGESYRPKGRRPSVYCSRSCKETARNARSAAKREASKPDRDCVWCGQAMPQSMRADAKFCCESCNSAAHAATRKAWQRMGYSKREAPLVLRAYIGDRDGWRCGVCRKSVSKKRRHPDPLAPSIDHVVPLSQGGTHDVSNLRITHLRCNLSRRAAGGGEQLAMA